MFHNIQYIPRFVFASTLWFADERTVGSKDHAFANVSVDLWIDLGILHLGEEVDVYALGPDIRKVTFRVVFEIIWHRHPDCPLTTLQVVLPDQTWKLHIFGTIKKHKNLLPSYVISQLAVYPVGLDWELDPQDPGHSQTTAGKHVLPVSIPLRKSSLVIWRAKTEDGPDPSENSGPHILIFHFFVPDPVFTTTQSLLKNQIRIQNY